MKKHYRFIFLIIPLLLSLSCRFYKLERRLKPDDADFLSKVRYIITGEERKIFLELPDSEKARFREEFWNRRDPDPATEENEFKSEYFDRIDRANELFSGEGKPGWLTDRGRIFILFGPPTERSMNSMNMGNYCQEVWYYGEFPVIFVDEHCTGSYILTAINLEHLQTLTRYQEQSQNTIQEDNERKFFDYEVSLRKDNLSQDKYEGTLLIQVPYTKLWFVYKNGKLEDVLRVQAELKTAAGEAFWKAQQEFKILVDEKELQTQRDKKYRMEIPLVLEGDLSALRVGENTLEVSLKTSTEEVLKKAVKFRLD